MLKKILAVIIALISIIGFSALSEQPPWDCPYCGREGNTGNFCGTCGMSVSDALKVKNTSPISVQIGDYVTFGKYEQDGNPNNGTEPIDWLVLDMNLENETVLLVSRYGLDAKPYNINSARVTWETCSLRKWLNNDFLKNAFSAEEQKAILQTTVDNSQAQGCDEYETKGGNNTQDKVFLLSYAEARICFMNDEARRCAPTDYAVQQNAYTTSNYEVDGKLAGWWWLRSPGKDPFFAIRVSSGGTYRSQSVRDNSGSVRPAIWINLESDLF